MSVLKIITNKAKAISAKLLELDLKNKLEKTQKQRGENWMRQEKTGRNRKKQEKNSKKQKETERNSKKE